MMYKKIFALILPLIFTITTLAQEDSTHICADGKIRAYKQLKKINEVQYPGDSNIDVTYYKLNLTLSYNPNYLSGVVTVKAKSIIAQLNSFFLDLVNALTVTSVTLDGKVLTFSQPQGSNLHITLDHMYSTGEEISVNIIYGGIPTSGQGFISNASFSFYDQTAGKPVIASLSEPYGARDWWPSKDTPTDKVDSSDVWVTADKFFVSVSNGKLVEMVDNPNGTRTYKWKNHYPIANYLISVAMTNYQTIDDQFEYEPGKFLPLIHYCYPERLNDTRRTAVAKTKDMLRIFSEKFGPYPYLKEKYGHAEFSWGGGMEHQTYTSMGSNAMNSENTIAHELAHQWFGDKVTCKNWENIWLNEGFASYSECIYREVKYSVNDFKSYVNNFMNNTNNGAKKAVGTIYVQNIASENEIFNSARSYKKGAIVLHILRGIVGDDKFFQILREYLDEPGLAYNVATTEDFQRVAERVCGMDLKYFFNEWIYGESYPKYTVGWNYRQVNGDNYTLVFRLKQSINIKPQFFTMPVQVKITTTNGVSTTTVFNNMQDQGWEIPVIGQPLSIEFDPNNWILKDIIGTTFIQEEPVPTSFYLKQNYPNPFNSETVISYQLPVAGFVTLKVYDLLGKEVATLVNEWQESGIHHSTFSIQHSSLSSGVYFYQLRASGPSTGSEQVYVETKKFVLMK